MSSAFECGHGQVRLAVKVVGSLLFAGALLLFGGCCSQTRCLTECKTMHLCDVLDGPCGEASACTNPPDLVAKGCPWK